MGAGFAAYRTADLRLVRRLGWAASGLIGIQAVIGIVLATQGNRPADPAHFVFGPLLVLSLPAAQLISARGAGERRQGVILAAGWLVTLAIGLRAVGTGGLG